MSRFDIRRRLFDIQKRLGPCRRDFETYLRAKTLSSHSLYKDTSQDLLYRNSPGLQVLTQCPDAFFWSLRPCHCCWDLLLMLVICVTPRTKRNTFPAKDVVLSGLTADWRRLSGVRKYLMSPCHACWQISLTVLRFSSRIRQVWVFGWIGLLRFVSFKQDYYDSKRVNQVWWKLWFGSDSTSHVVIYSSPWLGKSPNLRDKACAHVKVTNHTVVLSFNFQQETTFQVDQLCALQCE